MLWRVKSLALIALCKLIFTSASVMALDLRVLVDLSESTHIADEKGVRSELIRELVHFLPNDAQGSVWGYAGTTLRMVNHGPTDRMWRQVVDIHGRHLSVRGRQADPESAFRNVLWDLDKVDREPIELIWVGAGELNLGQGGDIGKSRDLLVNELIPTLASQRVRVHTLVLPEASEQGRELMRQMAESSGGLFAVATDSAQVKKYAEDVLRLIRAHGEALLDPRGRFQIGPGTERFTLLWQQGGSATVPELRGPNGAIYHRKTPLPDGRWLLAQDYEMVTINDPEPGWWEASGNALKVGVWSELDFVVSGLTSPVVPTDETSAYIEIFSDGTRVESAAFLDLLDVRAWLVSGGDKDPLPVERDQTGFRAYFVHLDDGAFELEVGVIGPTFAERTVVPFVAKNPLRVDVETSTGGAAAWLSFNHPDIDYRTLKATAKVRKPPQLAVLVPGQRMPGGVWQIPVGEQEGILEISFSISGNYLNGEGFFLKTNPAALTLPLPPGETQTFKFDASGTRLDSRALAVQKEDPEPVAQFVAAVAAEPSAAEQTPVPLADQVREEAPVLSLPIWFVSAVSGLNFCLIAFLWWFLRPGAIELPQLPDTDAAAA